MAVAAPSVQPTPAKERAGILKSLLSFVQYFSPDTARVFDMGTDADRLNATRAICEGKPADVRWREGRARVLAEDVKWEDGLMALTGIVRGAPLSANRLVHIPDHGDYQIAKVCTSLLWGISSAHQCCTRSCPHLCLDIQRPAQWISNLLCSRSRTRKGQTRS